MLGLNDERMERDEVSSEHESEEDQEMQIDSHLLSDDNTNPFLNPLVLSNLFEVCELADLFRFRLVSKQWYSLSLAEFRSQMTLNVNGEDWSKGTSYLSQPQLISQLEGFDVGNKPFKSIKTQGLMMFELPPDNFWDKLAPSIYKLELNIVGIHSVKVFKRAIFKDLPNLQVLKLRHMLFDEDDNDLDEPAVGGEMIVPNRNLKHLCLKRATFSDLSPINWSLFFLHFPSIQKLEIGEDSHAVSSVIACLVDTLESRFHQMVIKECILNHILYDESNIIPLKRLLQLPQLKLTSFHFDILGCEDESMTILPVALRSQRETLKELCVIDNTFNYFSDLQNVRSLELYRTFPCVREKFTALTALHLEHSVSKNLHFLSKFPNLKILRLVQYHGEKMLQRTNWKRLETLKLPHVETFKFVVLKNDPTHRQFYISEKIMKRFVDLLPNVKKLTAQLKAPALRVVCQNWRELRTLKLWDGARYLDDEVLTGIEKGKEDNHRSPNVADLRYLQHLSLIPYGGRKVSELSVNEVFFKLSFLHTLNIIFPHDISPEVYEAVKIRFPNGEVGCSEAPSGLCEPATADETTGAEEHLSDEELFDNYVFKKML